MKLIDSLIEINIKSSNLENSTKNSIKIQTQFNTKRKANVTTIVDCERIFRNFSRQPI